MAEQRLNDVGRERRLHDNRERLHPAEKQLPPDYEQPVERSVAIRPRDTVCMTRDRRLLWWYERRAALHRSDS